MDSKTYKEKVFFVLCITLTLALVVAAFGYRVVDQMDRLKTEWQTFDAQSAQRAEILKTIETNLGYGGFIHQFKNYVLRQDPLLIPKIEEKLASLHLAIDKYDSYTISEREHNALQIIQQTLLNYESKYQLARELIIAGIDTNQLDALVSVNDEPALEALAILSDTMQTHAQHYRKITSQRFSETQTLVRWGSLMLPLMLISSGLLIYLLRRILKAEKRIQYMAHFDMLTSLPNRSLFHDRLQRAILRVFRNNTTAALMFIDLDGFKQINDTLGHKMGDKLLKQVADRLQQALRKTDTVARLGGDEFTVIVENIMSAKHSEMIAQKILDALETPIMLEAHNIQISASIGISICPEDSTNDNLLMHYADLAMYEAKHAGKGQYRRYHASLSNQSVNHPSAVWYS